MVFSDDGNLPEFDFGTASGISSSSHRSDGSILGNRLQLSGSRILDTSKQPTRPVAPSVSVSIPRQMEEKLKSQSHAIPVAGTVCASGSPMAQFDSLAPRPQSSSLAAASPFQPADKRVRRA
ncbi:hypothetical protein T459_19071 [Capsicum annuum]|uniref:Uncharacterized protein n=1 Tax=Capsicum annuum TaxID=4072 RepID=A0A2G2Z0P1_CAPAN|nr:hypothetical protein T459_19071 [Capsicum annuum]